MLLALETLPLRTSNVGLLDLKPEGRTRTPCPQSRGRPAAMAHLVLITRGS